MAGGEQWDHKVKMEPWSYHAMVKREHANISAMMDMVPPDDGVAMVFYPDPR